MGLQLQDEREDITLAEETDNSYQPDFGLVVNSHKSRFSAFPINKSFMASSLAAFLSP
jgi:hypothetical protein